MLCFLLWRWMLSQFSFLPLVSLFSFCLRCSQFYGINGLPSESLQ
uniref:Putative P008-2 n=1 Tax=Homo sapiens TaxID=9606 RepID=Q5QTR8_HUMAN|nr:putative P008-2 [Homo sapiens]